MVEYGRHLGESEVEKGDREVWMGACVSLWKGWATILNKEIGKIPGGSNIEQIPHEGVGKCGDPWGPLWQG